MSLNNGTAIGPFDIVAPIGAGGMGEVYRAHDRKLERDVALKVLSAELSANADHLRRFEQEARAASALNHPNIVTIYDVGRADSIAYIAMEYVDGQDLRSLARGGRLPLKQVLRIATKVVEGLSAAHEKGIVHRDLKPENLIVTPDGFVKIVDFGLAKLVKPFSIDEPTMPHTLPGVVFGTVGYMSPEQASAKATDYRSDQFSFGVILYELLAGRRPFDRESGVETIASILRDEPVPLRELNPEVPAELQRIVERCLAKEPGDRYASTRDLARDLREIRDGLSGASGRRSTPPRPQARSRLVPVAVSIAAALVVIASLYLGWRDRAGRTPQPIRSIAVLPFHDVEGTSSHSFMNGLSEAVSMRIAQRTNVRVVAPFEGEQRLADDADVIDVARKRGVDVVLRCLLQPSGSGLQLSYSAYDAAGREIASSSVTGPSNDALALAELASENIVGTLHIRPRAVTAAVMATTIARPEDQRTYLEALGLLQQSKNEQAIDAAIERLQRLLLNARDSTQVNYSLSRAYVAKYILTHRNTYIDQAAIYADRAVQLDGSLPQAHVSAGLVALMTGRYDAAVAEFERALKADPASFEATLLLAQAYERMGRGANAEEKFEEALKLRPDSAAVFNSYGAFRQSRGQYEKALPLFRKVTELLPDSARGYTNGGVCLQGLGRYAEAIEQYRRSISIQPTSVAYSNLGTCQYSLGQYADACASFEQATRLAPENYLLWSNLGDAYRWTPTERSRAAEAFDRAIALARKELEINPKNALAAATTGSALAKRGDLQAARREIDSALRIDPTDPNVLYQACVVATLRNEHERALDWLARAIGAGYGAADAARDPELTPLHNQPAYRDALRQTKSST